MFLNSCIYNLHLITPIPDHKINGINQDTIAYSQQKDVLLIIDEDEPGWWEEAYLITPDTTLWLPVSSQSILSVQFVHISDEQTIYIELFDITHMGNGFYYLFAYSGKTLTLLLTTRAVDRQMENMGNEIDSSLILKNDKLDCIYIKNNTSPLPDILLTGAAQLTIGADDHVAKTITIQKQFAYNLTTKTYQPTSNTIPNYLDDYNR